MDETLLAHKEMKEVRGTGNSRRSKDSPLFHCSLWRRLSLQSQRPPEKRNTQQPRATVKVPYSDPIIELNSVKLIFC